MYLFIQIAIIFFISPVIAASNAQRCLIQNCSQTISHFVFSNDDSFARITSVAKETQDYRTQLTTIMKQLMQKIVDQEKGLIDSIKDKFTRDERKAEMFENALLTYNSTYLVINELFAQKLTNSMCETPQTPKIITDRLSFEILELIKKRTAATKRWDDDLDTNNPFFGFSLTRTMRESWSTFTKNLLGRLTSYITKTMPQNRLFYMTSLLKTIFTKINKLLYWHYVLKKINRTGVDITILRNIRDELNNWVKQLESYNLRISGNIGQNISLSADQRLEATVEVEIATNVIKLIEKNNTIIANLIPKQSAIKEQTAELQKPLCICPYLQTDMNMIEITLTEGAPAQKDPNQISYKKEVFASLLELAKKIVATKNDAQLSVNLMAQYCQLAVLYYQIWPSELKKELKSGGSPIVMTHGSIQNALIITKNLQLTKFIRQCDSIIQNISKYWIHQFSETQESSLANAVKWIPRKFLDWRKRRNYFFGFSLLTSSRKNSDFNRYTYMIRELESIFETVNLLLPWYTEQSMIDLICREQKIPCSSTNEIIKPLENLEQAFTNYQKHFFIQLISNYEQAQEQTAISSLATLKNQNGLQVGIEYAIVDRVSAWIKGNIEIINQKKPKPLIEKKPMQPLLPRQPNSNLSSSSEEEQSTGKPKKRKRKEEFYDFDDSITWDISEEENLLLPPEKKEKGG